MVDSVYLPRSFSSAFFLSSILEKERTKIFFCSGLQFSAVVDLGFHSRRGGTKSYPAKGKSCSKKKKKKKEASKFPQTTPFKF